MLSPLQKLISSGVDVAKPFTLRACARALSLSLFVRSSTVIQIIGIAYQDPAHPIHLSPLHCQLNPTLLRSAVNIQFS